ncbi:pentapeptide repeat-containing protein [Exiguobacterium sp. MER 193]|uniref:pentapeptide repeat-containing protein n=1 Tax=Exiguobacterium sp. MER 193 TaxID=2939564 RepID=UPI0020413C2B|nr:pentapeptide repeat-containing protein [Exiguobacterium sp. MER 193]MCM3281818.1 pentapeptide repeat-containing protein [Exiguobacterium sp. MER 193]
MRAKKKKKRLSQKAAAARRRAKKRRRGLNVPFSLANANCKFKGRTDAHDIKTNIHNLIFNNGTFRNVKYTDANITYCKFKNANFLGVDFINTNLKKSTFKNAKFKDVIFFGTNLKDVNFLNSTFENTYFVQTNIEHARNINPDTPGITILKRMPSEELHESLVDNITVLVNSHPELKKHFVLTTKSSKGKKINHWIIHILMQEFTQLEINKGIEKLKKNQKNKLFFTYYSYAYFLRSYLKKNATM